MIIKCGTDIIEIDRIKNIINKYEERFLNKIYTDNEIAYCMNKKNKYENLAARFAAKEAIYKSLDLNKPITWKNIEIINEENGKPTVVLKEKIEGLSKIEISISHCKEYAVADAIAIYEEQ